MRHLTPIHMVFVLDADSGQRGVASALGHDLLGAGSVAVKETAERL